MSMRHALLIRPAASDDDRADFSGTFVAHDPGAPALLLGDLAAQRGDGIFETVGVVDGVPHQVDAHVARLAHSAALCDLPAPNLDQWRQAIAAAATLCPAGEASVKLVLSRGVDGASTPTAWIAAGGAPDFTVARTRGIHVVTLDRGTPRGAAERSPWLLLGAKTLSYAVNMAALREAQRRGADDALFISSDGFLLEAPTATVLLRIDGRYVTPPPEAGILHGTTQLSAFAWLEARGENPEYRDVSVAELERADAAWLLSSVRLAAPVRAIDERELPVDAELTASLNDALRARTA
ncbi:aminodeoxychorismate lyase [Microbacterium sp. NPDC078428]|uniref:aminodeoxychorismate lyase n=1 Tax=Microbacterium sp. NPDC078428 TaxID=3364190 RepID=UPI0037C6B330